MYLLINMLKLLNRLEINMFAGPRNASDLIYDIFYNNNSEKYAHLYSPHSVAFINTRSNFSVVKKWYLTGAFTSTSIWFAAQDINFKMSCICFKICLPASVVFMYCIVSTHSGKLFKLIC